MRKSRAYRAFTELLSVSVRLLKMESKIALPVPARRAKESHGLKGGAIVLMVAAFETYLQDVFSEHVDSLNRKHPHIDITKMTDSVWTESVLESLDKAVRPTPNNPLPDKKSRLPDVIRACLGVVQSELDPKALSRTQGNPNASCLKELFRRFGVADLFGRIKAPFEVEQGNVPVANEFVAAKLDEIIYKRNAVAHNADVQNIARSDLTEYISFLRCLSSVIDDQLSQRTREIEMECRRPTRRIRQ